MSCACASPRRRPASLRASGSRPPRARWARVSAERLPRNSMSTWFSASLDAAPSIARAPSAVMPSMSKSTLSSAMSPNPCRQVPGRAVPPPAMLRGAAPPPRRCRKASKQTTAQATPTLSDSARPAIGMPRVPDEGADELGSEPRGLVAQEEGRGYGPVEIGVVLPVPHHRGERAEAGGGQVAWPARPGPAARPGARGRASRPRSAPSWGCRGRPNRRRRRPGRIPRRPPPAARSRRCPGRARRPGPRSARPRWASTGRRPVRAPPAWAARPAPAAG